MKAFNKDKAIKKMRLKQNKETYIKRLSVSLSCLFLVVVVMLFTYAKYESGSQEYTLMKGKIIGDARDVNVSAVYKGNELSSDIPAKGSGWAFQSAECTDGASATWDYKNWGLDVRNITNKTKCTLHFENKEYIQDQILKLVEGEDSSSSETVIDKGTGSDGCTNTFAYDGTADNNLRYVGKNPCNYITYNNELWRIIGVINNVVTDSNDNSIRESLVKIIRVNSLGSYSWDSSNGSVNANYGINQWGESTYTDETPYEGSDIMRELNTDYLGNITVGTDGKWFSANNNTKVAMPESTLDATSQAMIQNVVWNTGVLNSDNVNVFGATHANLLTPYIYEHERYNTTIRVCVNATYCNDTVERTNTWYGKVGLYSVSDYGYATAGGTTYNRSKCLGYRPGAWNSYGNCYQNNWLYDSTGIQWTMNSAVNASYATYAVYIHSNGQMYFNNAYSAYNIKPVLFLKPNVFITDGDGSQANPYTIAIDN